MKHFQWGRAEGCLEMNNTLSEIIKKSNQINFVFTKVAHNSHATDKPVALEFPIKLEFRNVDFYGGRKTGEPTCDTGSKILTQATLVGGERDHHCAIPAPHIIKFKLSDTLQ